MLAALKEVPAHERPPEAALTDLFATMFFASLQTEEGRATRFDVVYLNPDNPDPEPPQRLRRDRWRFVAFSCPLECTVESVTKLAQASDPRSSAFVVYARGTKMQVWGLVDQGTRYHDYVSREVQSRPARPGLFQAGIAGPARISAHANGKRIAELRSTLHSRDLVDPLSAGPVRKALEPGIRNYVAQVGGGPEEPYLSTVWMTAIRRVLLRAQSFRHGGALLITPDTSLSELDVKYPLDYPRLPEALVRLGRSTARLEHMADELGDIVSKQDAIPFQLFRDYDTDVHDVEESRTELQGVISFISLLTRVDGLILMDPSLRVRGFGVVITGDESGRPVAVYRTTTRTARLASLTEIDFEHYGTRHRSVMRYCNRHPGSVGFVVSQDGDVRAITRVGERLVMWDNINLQGAHHIVLKHEERHERHRAPRAV